MVMVTMSVFHRCYMRTCSVHHLCYRNWSLLPVTSSRLSFWCLFWLSKPSISQFIHVFSSCLLAFSMLRMRNKRGIRVTAFALNCWCAAADLKEIMHLLELAALARQVDPKCCSKTHCAGFTRTWWLLYNFHLRGTLFERKSWSHDIVPVLYIGL